MHDPSPRPARLPHLVAGFAVVYLVWGSTFLGIKFAVETIPPFLMAACRFLASGAILYAFLRLRGVAAPTARQWRFGAWTGALLLLGGNGLVTWGMQTVPSGKSALIIATTPLWMVLLEWLLYRGERPSLRVWFGLAAGFAGAALLVHPAGDVSGGTIAGFVALLAAPVCWSAGSLESRRLRPSEDPILTSAMQMLAGGGLMLITGSVLGEWSVLMDRAVSTWSLLALAYLTVFGGIIAFTTYAWLLRVASPTAVSTYAYVNPLVAVLLGWLVVDERLDARVAVAGVLILGAVLLITLRPKKGETPARPLIPPEREVQSTHIVAQASRL
jgi:drug/metabolite transporter (DMT)-like permease